MKTWTLLVAVGVVAVSASARAQAPGAPPSASATPPNTPPPGPAPLAPPGPQAAPPAADAATSQPSAAPAPAPAPATDNWSAAISNSKSQENTEFVDVRQDNEDRQQRQAFETTTLPIRKRLRLFVSASAGVQNYGGIYFDYEPPVEAKSGFAVRSVSFYKVTGFSLSVGAGLRGSIAENFDLQARLGLSYANLSSQMDIGLRANDEYGSYGYAELEDIATHWLGAQLEGTARWLPQLMAPRFFIGLGPKLELYSFNASSGKSSNAPDIDVNELVVAAGGVLELGVIFGADEAWEAGIRASLGYTLLDHGKDAEFVGASLARAF